MESRTLNPGEFCWVEVVTTDIDASKDFYQSLLGWSSKSQPLPDGGSYTMYSVGEKTVAGGFPLNQEMKSQGIPPHWASYVLVNSADESASKVEALGGKILKAPFDVMDMGRMAVFADPTGATCSVWESKVGKTDHWNKNTPGMFGWQELATTDTDRAAEFYCGLFGWTTQAQSMPNGMKYTIFNVGEIGAGGMLQMNDEWKGIPPHWHVYFTVEDCDAKLAQAKELGAKPMHDPIDVPEVGRFCVIQDPQGAVFSIIKFVPTM